MPEFVPQTARIPELTNPTPYLDQISLEDKVPYYIDALNKTTWMKLLTIQQLIQSGDGEPLPGATNGNEIIYEVPASAVGGNTYNNASIAGKDFNLTLEGRPMLKNVEYEVLSAGGFKLLGGATFVQEGQRYALRLFELTGNGGGGGSTASLFTGAYPNGGVNLIMDTNHFGKLIQLRAGNSKVKVTLTTLEDAPANAIVAIETLINNTRPAEIATKNGQLIYMNGVGSTSIFLHPCEVVWLFKTSEGWFVINNFNEIYKEIGTVVNRFGVGIGELELNGAELSREEYPRLWAYAQSVPNSLVDDSVWLISEGYDSAGNLVKYPNKGCFSRGNGSTSFRIPNFQNTVIRHILPGDTERRHNHPGGRQDDAVVSHYHETGSQPTPLAHYTQGSVHQMRGYTATTTDASGQASTASSGGSETRMKNTGMLFCIKY